VADQAWLKKEISDMRLHPNPVGYWLIMPAWQKKRSVPRYRQESHTQH